jgi:hypothetical protein
MAHSSTFLISRDALVNRIGLVDENAPGSMCEDWDLLLRASKLQPIVNLNQPLVRVLWGETSYFSGRWELKNSAHEWMLTQHPDILASRVGASRVYGQLAFGHAALGDRRAAAGFAFKSLRLNWREPRAIFALGVVCRLVSDRTVLDLLHKHGRGI